MLHTQKVIELRSIYLKQVRILKKEGRNSEARSFYVNMADDETSQNSILLDEMAHDIHTCMRTHRGEMLKTSRKAIQLFF